MDLFNLSSAHPIAERLLSDPDLQPGEFELRHFPDGESYICVTSKPSAEAAIFCDLSAPNGKLLPLLLLADTLRDLGWRRITLLTPYLPYMRQDIRFKQGEGITSRYFAKILSASFDHLITIDPHLHRYHSLDEIYSLSSQVLSASAAIAQWIREEVPGGVIVGPDSESDQWVSSVARMAGCEQLVFNKTRAGDKDVSIDAGDLSQFQGRTPIMVDDIISTGRTMIEAAEQMVAMGLNPPVCIGVHALFADDAWQAMLEAPLSRVVTCNTVQHPTNGIDVGDIMLKGLLNR
ncbi:phosphoribosylpyrophosphate synthetase [Hahella sp. CCB-MM4]|uniref:ribose-phosphate diphosphokinase n=1 Tax=Hahella sp. (strain CCB-MM4) TaxID=1926491 RepID=UPI000B9A3A0F|nr:ribose-phosphate diphosphokinase [Hahella sp. CCB-MM4]OZG71876.1 phosphoribosylpyrophosphate synthetase [Hahella sp. CCB-MM4]